MNTFVLTFGVEFVRHCSKKTFILKLTFYKCVCVYFLNKKTMIRARYFHTSMICVHTVVYIVQVTYVVGCAYAWAVVVSV